MKSLKINPGSVSISRDGELHMPHGAPNGRAALILHEAPGITSNVKRRCAMLASMGYVVLAPNLHRSVRLLDAEEAAPAIAVFRASPQLLRDRVEEDLNRLCTVSGVSRRKVVVLGYCFGGMAALELARSGAEVAAVASFHGLLATNAPAQLGRMKSPILVCTGGLDELVPAADIFSFQQEMTEAKASWELVVYGQAKHSFTNMSASVFGDPRMKHDAYADKKSWAAMLDFIESAYAARETENISPD